MSVDYRDKITVGKYNEVFFRLTVSRSQGMELLNYFSEFATNYMFQPKYRAGFWNGKTYFYDINNSLLPIGFYKELNEFAKKFNYQIIWKLKKEEFCNNFTDEDFSGMYNSIFKEGIRPRDYQDASIKASLKYKRGTIQSITGCHVKGTKILMYDGTFKNVEDVKIGDQLIGPDGLSRNVLKLYTGEDDLYKIIPVKGNEFIVNKDHILHINFSSKGNKRKKETKLNISIEDYLKFNDSDKYISKLISNDKELEFVNNLQNDTKLLPYFVGLYLGDGHVDNCAITTMDYEIMNDINNQCDEYGKNFINIKIIKTKSKADTITFSHVIGVNQGLGNPIFTDFKKLKLYFGSSKKMIKTKCEDKFIPDVFKYGSVEDRYEILAGLIDTDGCLTNNSYYEIISKSEKLIDDVIFVARSLGFFVTKKIKHNKKYNRDYYKCHITGNISKIPVRIERKKSNFTGCSNKKFNINGFKVEKYGFGEYFGFELDKDHLYYTDDFVIHHNSGKSLVLYGVIRFLLNIYPTKKILLVVPNISLVKQLAKEFEDYGFENVMDYISPLFNGQTYDAKKPILISTWQSIYKRPMVFFKDFCGVLIDECQTVKSTSILAILKKCMNAEYRLGFTGTLPEDQAHLKTIIGYLGPTLYNYTYKEAMDQNVVSNIKIANILLKYPEVVKKYNKGRPYNEEVDYVTTYEPRNKVFKFIFDKLKIGDNVLILCHKIEHLKNIKKYLEDNIKDREIYEIYGKTKADDRESIRQDMDQNKGKILVATFKTMAVGVNIRRIDHIIFASSYKSKILILQSIGRGLRKYDGKKFMVLWDLVDDLTLESKKGSIHKNHIYKHYEQRLGYYDENSFKYLTCKVELDKLE